MKSADRRTLLIQAARDAFADAGWHATGTAAVAARAGVSEALVLKHFGTKANIYRAAVIEPLLELLRTRLAPGFPRDVARRGPAEHLANTKSFLVAWARLVRGNEGLLLSLLHDIDQFPEEEAELFEIASRHVAGLVALIDGATHRDEYRQVDARSLVYTSLAAATVAGVTCRNDDDIERFIDGLLTVFAMGVLSESARGSWPYPIVAPTA